MMLYTSILSTLVSAQVQNSAIESVPGSGRREGLLIEAGEVRTLGSVDISPRNRPNWLILKSLLQKAVS